ncbi:MAG TPA: glycosyltransferase family A protein [Gaiellaceae bacterium]|nr:glycosyltransferase family A protein [Gaiellaceae bacterium]
MTQELPSFDLVVATVGRIGELARLLASVEAQGIPHLRVIVVDQNDDNRLAKVVDGRGLELLHLRSGPGLSHARNAGLEHLSSDIVAFPDDDCIYPPGLLQRVAERLAANPGIDGLTGRAVDASGASSASWKTDAAVLTDDNLWNRAISYTIFLRRAVVERVGAFDERLGLGSPEPWASGEEIDYLIRAIRGGAQIEYDPSLVVRHDVRLDDRRVGARDGASVGYLLRKHAYRRHSVARMLLRPLGGIVSSLARMDPARASYHTATFRGRIRGYRGASRSKTSR